MAFDYLNLDGLTYFERKLKSKVAGSSDIDEIFGKKAVEILPFSTATDAQVTAMLEAVRNGDISVEDLGWNVGDEHTVHLSAMDGISSEESHIEQDQTLAILHGSDAFDLVDGGRNLFVIGLKNCLLETGTLGAASSMTNVGGWSALLRRPWLDSDFMGALPEEVQKWFKKFKYKASDGGKLTTSTELENYFTYASRYEVFGGEADSTPESENTVHFDYYKTEENRVKRLGDDGEYSIYSLRSADLRNSDSFLSVHVENSTIRIVQSYPFQVRGISPFGCV